MSFGERSVGLDGPKRVVLDVPLEQPRVETDGVYGNTGEGTPPAELAGISPALEESGQNEKKPSKKVLPRRSILKLAGWGALSIMIAERATVKVLDGLETNQYSNNATEFTNGTPELPQTGGNEVILFGGFGEYDTTDYATGLGKKLITPTRTVGVRYSAEGVENEEMGYALYDHLRRTKPEKVALDMTSMGAQTGLTAYSLVSKNQHELEKQWAVAHNTKPDYSWEIPPVSLIAANGSPASLENASMKDVANIILELHELTGYTPGIDVKWLYECLNDQEGLQKTIGLEGARTMLGQWVDGFKRAREVPDALIISQLKALADFRLEQTFKNLQDCVGAFTTFCYFKAEGWRDPVVNERDAAPVYIEDAKSIDVKEDNIKIVSTGEAYHASRWGADNYLPAIIDEAFGYTDKYFERLNNKTNPDLKA